jgi:hypothetical protein
MVVLLFLCNFSWAAEHHPVDRHFVKTGKVNPASQDEPASVLSICTPMNHPACNYPFPTILIENLPSDTKQPSPIRYNSLELKHEISSTSIAINAP